MWGGPKNGNIVTCVNGNIDNGILGDTFLGSCFNTLMEASEGGYLLACTSSFRNHLFHRPSPISKISSMCVLSCFVDSVPIFGAKSSNILCVVMKLLKSIEIAFFDGQAIVHGFNQFQPPFLAIPISPLGIPTGLCTTSTLIGRICWEQLRDTWIHKPSQSGYTSP